MLMIIELILTIKAYKKGWKARAFLPAGCALLMGVGAGLFAGANGLSADQINRLTLCMLPVELLLTCLMGWMASRCPADAKEKSSLVPETTSLDQHESSPLAA